jgi:hypothetical protein
VLGRRVGGARLLAFQSHRDGASGLRHRVQAAQFVEGGPGGDHLLDQGGEYAAMWRVRASTYGSPHTGF